MFIPVNPWPATAPHWLYDEIMRHIEPDLMMERVPLLEKKYAGETAQEKEDRMARYDRAFALYDAWHKNVTEFISDEARNARHAAQKHAMNIEGQERAGELSTFEQQFGSALDA